MSTRLGSLVMDGDLRALVGEAAEGVYGMQVYARRFFRALLDHGGLDEIHLFRLGDPRQAPPSGGLLADERIRVRPLQDFESALRDHEFLAFHHAFGNHLAPWLDLRRRLSPRHVPITGITHTISYPSMLPRLLSAMAEGFAPWDSIICTAPTAVVAMRRWIQHVEERIGETIANRPGLDLSYRARLDLIPLAVDPATFAPGDAAALRADLGLPADAVVLLYVGRFSPYDKMDLEPLLEAVRLASAECRERLHLVLAGGDRRFSYAGTVLERAEALGIADRVEARTNVSDPELLALYRSADVFVSPSDNLQETFGQSIIEAMACGLPVVCSDWDGYRELVVEGETGFRVPTYWADCQQSFSDYAAMSDWLSLHFHAAQSLAVDVRAYADALSRLAGDPELRRAQGRAGRRRVLARYAWPVVIDQYVQLWRELSDIARAAPPHEQRRRSWSRPDYFQTFQHYATGLVVDTTRVIATPARELVWLPALDPWIAGDLLEALRAGAESWTPVGDLVARLAAAQGKSPEGVRFHVQWLLKHGHLRLDPASVAAPGPATQRP